MKAQAEKIQQSTVAESIQMQASDEHGLRQVDKRANGLTQFKMQEIANKDARSSKTKVIQNMADNFGSQRAIQKKANSTGLPDQLKTGVENLSGVSLDDVKVHYNSAKPAQLQAHAHAQGSEIHLASGQEKHLPHEAWHVVQQKQGRVQPTTQLKGIALNDQDNLEQEATLMGNKAMQLAAFGPLEKTVTSSDADMSIEKPVVQRAKYMRAVNSNARVANEVASLRRQFMGDVSRQNQVNTWVDGFAGMPTTRYNPGQTHYYSPVGYMLETNNNADVLSNYRGDGNTNDIPRTHIKWVNAIKAVVAQLKTIPYYLTWLNGPATDAAYIELSEHILTVNDAVNEATANWLYQTYITDFLTAARTENSVASNAAATQALALTRNVAAQQIAAHYSQAGQNRYLGTGVNPDGMEDAEDDDRVPYTESILHARFQQVVAAWYSPVFGAYTPAQAGDATWIDPAGNWMNARKTSAEYIKQQFDAQGANLEVIALNQATDTSGLGGSYSFTGVGNNFSIVRHSRGSMGQAIQRTKSYSIDELLLARISSRIDEAHQTEITITSNHQDYEMVMSANDAVHFHLIVERFKKKKGAKLFTQEQGKDYILSFDAAHLTIKKESRTLMGVLQKSRSNIPLNTITDVAFEDGEQGIEITIIHGHSSYVMNRSRAVAEEIRTMLLRNGLAANIVGALPPVQH